MPIQDLSNAAEHNFRTLEEIERYLETLKQRFVENVTLLHKYEVQFARTEQAATTEFKINVTKTGKPMKRRAGPHIQVNKFKRVAIPDVEKLSKNFALVDELFGMLDTLKTLESIAMVNFKGKPGVGKIVEGIKQRRAVTEKAIKKAQDFLTNIGEKKEPTVFKDFVEQISKILEAHLDYEDFENFVYLTPDQNSRFRFTHYLRLIGLTDDENNEYTELYVVFTCILIPIGKKQVEAEYYVNVLYEFQTPGKFETGTRVDAAKGAALVIGTILEQENFANTLGTLPLNLDESKIKKEQFGVKGKIFSVEVDEKTISFNLNKGVKEGEIARIVQQLYVDVKGLVHRVRAKLKVRVTKALGRHKITFTLSNVAGDGQVSVDDAKWLQEQFGVDDDKLRRIVRIINGG